MLKKNFLHWVACVILVACWLSPSALFAQQGAGVLTGNVTDAATKQPLGDVVVTATSPALQGEQTVVTDASGLFRIPDLPPGSYTLRMDKEHYRPYSRDGIGLRVDTTLRVNAELLPESLKAEEVTVVARPPTVDVGSSSTGMNISSDFTHRVPVSRPGQKGSGARSFESVAEVVPGAREDAFGVSINGTTSPENNYVLDGTSVNNPGFGTIGTALSLEFIKEVNVISGGYMPEYGRATGGILNVVTKSGSNEFHGGVFAYYTPGALEGTRKQIIRAGQTVSTNSTLGFVGDIGADLGGPIQKDKLWFYVGVDISRTRLTLGRQLNQTVLDAAGMPTIDPTTNAPAVFPIPGGYTPYKAESTQVQAMGKLTYLVNPDNTLSLALFATPSTSGGGGNYAISPETGQPENDPRFTTGLAGQYNSLATKRVYNSYDASLKWSSAFSNKRVLLDTTVGWHRQNTSILPADGSDPGSMQGLAGQSAIVWRRNSNPGPHSITEPQFGEPVPAGYCLTAAECPVSTFNTGGTFGQINKRTLDRYQAKSILTTLFQAAGHHVVKAGVDVEFLRYDHTKAVAGQITFREATNGNSFTDYRNYGFLQGPDNLVLLPFVHSITKSSAFGGFVQDSWSIVDKVTLNAGLRYDAQFLYNAQGELGLALPNQFSPRVGAIYDPTEAGRAKIYGNWAIFYEQVPLDAADRSLSSEPAYTASRVAASAAAPCAGTGATTGPCVNQLRILSPDDPNQKFGTVGAGATAVDPDIKPQSTQELVFGGEYEVIKDGRVGASYTKRWVNRIIEDMSRDEATTYFLGNPGYGIASDFPKPVRDYDAITVYFSKVFADEWLGEVSYTWSHLRGNFVGLFRPENQQLDPNINSDFDLRSLLDNTTGDLPGDRRHQIKVFGAKDWTINLEHHVTTGLGFRAHSGDPTNFLGSHPVYGPDLAFILPRASGERLPWNFGADLQLGYRFNIDKDKSVQVSLDVFNLFNFQGETAHDQRYTDSDVLPIKNGTVANLPGPGATTCAPPTCLLTHSDGTPFDPTTEKNINFGRPTEYQPPRQFRFGIRTTF